MEREREMEMVLEIGREKSLGRCIKISEDDIFYIARVLFPFLFFLFHLTSPGATTRSQSSTTKRRRKVNFRRRKREKSNQKKRPFTPTRET
jgi:hypothetical protein